MPTVRTLKFVVFAAALSGASLLPRAAAGQTAIPGPCVTGLLPGGAGSLMCVPAAGWNGELVVFAHGYVAPGQPLSFYHLTLTDGTPLPALVQSLGFAFATTTFRKNGLAILEGVEDIRQLTAAFAASHTVPLRTHVAGVSEGGLIATLLAERSPELFSSALATCGPIGSFSLQVNVVGDFRVLFDYFFPGIIPGSPINIPAAVMTNWQTVYVPRITAALAAAPGKALELMRVSHAAYDPAAPATVVNTAIELLWYNVFGTNDAIQTLGGNPFGNGLRLYLGSSNDVRLNLRVQRFASARAARSALRAYETSGVLSIPVVSLHTTGDDVVPFWHELLYLGKADLLNRGGFIPIPVQRYGHCNFTTAEVAGAFALSVKQP
jgi:pimeloyl-ACP methyl ester carboxylesterase